MKHSPLLVALLLGAMSSPSQAYYVNQASSDGSTSVWSRGSHRQDGLNEKKHTSLIGNLEACLRTPAELLPVYSGEEQGTDVLLQHAQARLSYWQSMAANVNDEAL